MKNVLCSGNLFKGSSNKSIPAGTYTYTGSGNFFNIGTGAAVSTNYSATNSNWNYVENTKCVVKKLSGTDMYDITQEGPNFTAHFEGKVNFMDYFKKQ